MRTIGGAGAVNEHVEAQWLYFHNRQCKDMVVCNIYRPPNGDLKKAITYWDDCLKTLNLSKINLFLLGDFNINYKKFSFFVQSNSLTQHITATTRNSDKTKSLLDLAISNSKYVADADTLDHFISDHQPIYIIHKKGHDLRESVHFEGRSYRNFDGDVFKRNLSESNWQGLYELTDPDEVWDLILKNITLVLDSMCPIRTSKIKNYRPHWMTKELIEQVKDRDYFYNKAKLHGDRDDWNIAKHLRNVTNANIRQAKREFILEELATHDNDQKKIWKTIHKVVPSKGSNQAHDILLKDGETKIVREEVAHFINDYFVNVGNFKAPEPPRVTHSAMQSVEQVDQVDQVPPPELEKFERVKDRVGWLA